MNFTDIFIRRPVLASVVSLVILVVGLRAVRLAAGARSIRRPRTASSPSPRPIPGADPDVVAGFITTPIEAAIAQANGIDYMTSTSQSGTSTITVNLRQNYDSSKAAAEINIKVNSVLNQLPVGSQQPSITVKVGQTTDAHVYGFFKRHARTQPSHRLSAARRAAQAAGGRGRADRRNHRRPVLLAARVARSEETCGLRNHGLRCVHGALQQRLHLRPSAKPRARWCR